MPEAPAEEELRIAKKLQLKAEAQVLRKSQQDLHVGTRVLHNVKGYGKVTHYDTNEPDIAMVDFDNGPTNFYAATKCLQVEAPEYCFTQSAVDSIRGNPQYMEQLRDNRMSLPSAGEKFTLAWFNWFGKNTLIDSDKLLTGLLENGVIVQEAKAEEEARKDAKIQLDIDAEEARKAANIRLNAEAEAMRKAEQELPPVPPTMLEVNVEAAPPMQVPDRQAAASARDAAAISSTQASAEEEMMKAREMQVKAEAQASQKAGS